MPHVPGRATRHLLRVPIRLAGRLPLPRVEVEARRLRLVAACGLSDAAAAQRAYDAYATHAVAREGSGAAPLVSEARLSAARALLERCTAQRLVAAGGPEGAGQGGRDER
jgi:hypothetical protein